MLIVIDGPPLIAHLAAHLLSPQHTVYVVEKHEVYPLAGTNIYHDGTIDPTLEKIMRTPGIIGLSAKGQGPHLQFYTCNNPEAIVYDVNVIQNHIRSTNTLSDPLKFLKQYPSTTYIKILCNTLYSINYTATIIDGKATKLVWVPAISRPLHHHHHQHHHRYHIIDTNVLPLDLMSCIKMAHLVYSMTSPIHL